MANSRYFMPAEWEPHEGTRHRPLPLDEEVEQELHRIQQKARALL